MSESIIKTITTSLLLTKTITLTKSLTTAEN